MHFDDQIFKTICEAFQMSEPDARLNAETWEDLLQWLGKEDAFKSGQISAYKESLKSIKEKQVDAYAYYQL